MLQLSGGQKQRLFILLAVIHNPDIVFFDELSTGLDPVSRQEIWNYVGERKKAGQDHHRLDPLHAGSRRDLRPGHAGKRRENRGHRHGLRAEGKAALPPVLEFECIGEEEKILQDLQRACGFCGAEKLPPKRYRVFITDQFSIDRFLETQREAVTAYRAGRAALKIISITR